MMKNEHPTIRLSVRLTPIFILFTILFCGLVSPLASQTREQTFSQRKVMTRVEPEYPETLKRLYIGGTVRVEVVVDPDGGVDKVQLLGGSPILGQSAMKAIKQWKYARASSREKLVVLIEFDPHL